MKDGRADNEALGWQPFSQPMGGGSDCDGDPCDLPVAHPHRRTKSERQAEEAPILIRNAVTRDKSVELIRTGTSKEPGHYLSYRILFQLDDGTEEWLSVPPEYYEAIPVGVRDKLITQNGVFLDYGDRFGKEIL